MSLGFVQTVFNPLANPPLRAVYIPPYNGTTNYSPQPPGPTPPGPPDDGTPYFISMAQGGVDITGRRGIIVPSNSATTVGILDGAPPGGTYTFRAYTAANGGSPAYESAAIVVPADSANTLSGVPSSGTAGSALASSVTFAAPSALTPYAALLTSAVPIGELAGSALVAGSAVALSGLSGTVPARTPTAAGTFYLALLTGAAGVVIARSSAITVAAVPTAIITGITLAPVSSIAANSAVETPVGTLSPQSSGSALVNPTWTLPNSAGGDFKVVGTQVRFAVSNVPQGSYTIRARLVADNAAAFEQNLTVTVAAASATQGNGDVTLTGMPSSIVAGQPLSGVTFAFPVGGYGQANFVLFNVTTGAEEGPRIPSNSLPANNLGLFTPQTNALYTMRAYNFDYTALLFQSTQIAVSAPPGPLPARVQNLGDTGRTQTGVTMNWTATAPTYRLLTRPGFGSPYGSLVDTITSATSYTFTGLAAGSAARSLVVPQNSNGTGMTSFQFISSTSF